MTDIQQGNFELFQCPAKAGKSDKNPNQVIYAVPIRGWFLGQAALRLALLFTLRSSSSICRRTIRKAIEEAFAPDRRVVLGDYVACPS
jgi:hypothetical protein